MTDTDTVSARQARRLLCVSRSWWDDHVRSGYVPLLRIRLHGGYTRVDLAWLREVTRGIAGPFVRASAVASDLGVSLLTIRRWIRAGKITAIRLGPKACTLRVPTSEVDRLFNENAVGRNTARRAA